MIHKKTTKEKLIPTIYWKVRNGFGHYGIAFGILLIIYVLAYSTVFRANYDYMDDLGRAFSGYHGWLDYSRWFSEIVSAIIHADWYLMDISPVPQLLSCGILAATSLILIRLFVRQWRDVSNTEVHRHCFRSFFILIAASICGIFPYTLAMVSYKYDSVYMTFSILISVFPFLFCENSTVVYCSVSFICTLLMCTSYQASSGIYPMVCVMVTLLSLNYGRDKHRALKLLIKSVLSYILALLLFRFCLMLPNDADPVSASGILSNIIDKYRTYYSYVCHDMKKGWILLILAIVILFIVLFVRSSTVNRALSVTLALLFVLWGSISCFGVNLLFARDTYDCRLMAGFGVFVSILGLNIVGNLQWNSSVAFSEQGQYEIAKRNVLIKRNSGRLRGAGGCLSAFVIIAAFWCFLTFAFSYGNALAVQKDYRNYRAQLVADDLEKLPQMESSQLKTLHIIGAIPLAPSLRNMSSGYDLIPRLIHTGLGSGTWGEYYLTHYLDIPNINSPENETVSMNEAQEYPVLVNTMYHVIYGNDHIIIIQMK